MQFRFETDIQEAIKYIESIMEQNVARTDIAFCSLVFHDILSVYQDSANYEFFEIENSSSGKKCIIKITVRGKKYDPLAETVLDFQEEPVTFGGEKAFSYRYAHGCNFIYASFFIEDYSPDRISFLWRALKGEKWTLIAICFFRFFMTGISILLPVLSAAIIKALTGSVIKRILFTVCTVVLTRLFYNLVIYADSYCAILIFRRISISLTSELTKKTLDMKTGSVQHYGSAAIIQYLTRDIENLKTNLDSLWNQISSCLFLIGTLIAMAMVSPVMFIYQTIATVVQIVTDMYRTKVYKNNLREQRVLDAKYLGIANETVRANREIKLLGGKHYFLSRVQESNKALVDFTKNMFNKNYLITLVRRTARDILDGGFLALLALLLLKGTLDGPDAIVLYSYNTNLFGSTGAFGTIAECYRNCMLSCERLSQFLHSEKFPEEHFGERHKERLNGGIKVENVSFFYPGIQDKPDSRLILKDISFTIQPGEYVAFTGRSACGKTTLINLLSKLYTVEKGAIYLDDFDIKSYDEDTVRKNIAIVPQNPYILNMSIRDNLLLARADATQEMMEDVCRQACIHEEILRMPNGYDTVITEGGNNISGGQRQRLAIAMAILRNTPIILLDEATSALDNVLQDQVQKNISKLGGQRTIIVIAHRLSTIVNCNRIFYFEDGTIAASGTHHQLMETCKAYRDLYTLEIQ